MAERALTGYLVFDVQKAVQMDEEMCLGVTELQDGRCDRDARRHPEQLVLEDASGRHQAPGLQGRLDLKQGPDPLVLALQLDSTRSDPFLP